MSHNDCNECKIYMVKDISAWGTARALCRTDYLTRSACTVASPCFFAYVYAQSRRCVAAKQTRV